MDREQALSLLRSGPDGVSQWNLWRHGDRRSNGRNLDFTAADLSGANLENADFTFTKFTRSNFSGARLMRAKFDDADFDGADFHHAELHKSIFSQTRLLAANFQRASCFGVNFIRARLAGANFYGARLMDATFRYCDVRESNFAHATCIDTIFSRLDLSSARGLETVLHHSQSTISLSTLRMSKGSIPDVFLRGCGFADEEIAFAHSYGAIQFYSCVISYSTDDELFVTRLYNDLQASGIRCWKWDYDAKTGKPLWSEIDDAIRLYDRLVLIASKSSLLSPAVNREIERAFQQEDERKRRGVDSDVLFPVRLDDYIFNPWEHACKADVTSKTIADGREWDVNALKYAQLLKKLVRDLKRDTPLA